MEGRSEDHKGTWKIDGDTWLISASYLHNTLYDLIFDNISENLLPKKAFD